MPSPNEVLNRAFDATNDVMKVTSGGTVASGATDSGNPVKVGGVYNTALPTLANGQRGDLQLDSSGLVLARVRLADSFGNGISQQTPGDALSGAPTSILGVASYALLYNGSTYQRDRANEETTLLASSARTTTQTGSDLTNYNGNTTLIVVLDMTTVGTGSVTLTIEGKDTASGKYYTILSGAAVTTNSTNRYRVSPNLAAAANSVAQDVLPRVFRINVTANNANTATYSVGYCLVGR